MTRSRLFSYIRSNRFRQVEVYFFYFLLLLHIAPVFLIDGFTTIDGTAHTYNAHLIHQLLFGEAELLRDFYEFNAFWIPNSLGHYLLVFLQFFFSPTLSEKLLIALIIFGLGSGMRQLWKQFSQQYAFWSFFAFPLIFSLSFFFGFYNFMLALIFYLFLIALQIKSAIERVGRVGYFISLLLLYGLIYFSHSLIFVLTLFSIGGIQLIRWLTKAGNKFSLKQLNYLIAPLLPALPFAWLFLIYYSKLSGSTSDWYYLPRDQLLNGLLDSRTLVVFNADLETTFSQAFSILLGLLLIYRIVLSLLSKTNSILNVKAASACFLLLSYLVFYFIFPEYTADGGIIIIRIQLLLLIFLIAFLSLKEYPILIRILTFSALFYIHFSLATVYLELQEERGKEFLKYETIAKEIEPNSIVLPFTKSGWDREHFNNVIGFTEGTVVLFNYEMLKNYFPLKTKSSGIPSLYMGELPIGHEMIDFLPQKQSREIKQVDYILLHENDQRFQESEALIMALGNNYELILKEGNLKLYKLITSDGFIKL